ncbi:hypothetical protein [Amycolatopsis keratiniphila]|uniref:Uncharacterized protein n=1 Tax=Amycolatopsis keratiniphila TaxID=129921 RepID=R4T0M4_9PSEU|nr:hypothetical protein [Amycolatopsis keratiniphila]AGM05936.1 hypothetical protein AORI_3351 [Amycolatopsis keratiniphila]
MARLTLAVFLVVFLVNHWFTPDTVNIEGIAKGACEVLKQRLPVRVAQSDGEERSGSLVSAAIVMWDGSCQANFRVADVPERKSYLITVGPTTRLVDAFLNQFIVFEI